VRYGGMSGLPLYSPNHAGFITVANRSGGQAQWNFSAAAVLLVITEPSLAFIGD